MAKPADTTTANLLSDIEAMMAATKAHQPDTIGRRYGYHILDCQSCSYRLRLEYQPHDDTQHQYSWPFEVSEAPHWLPERHHFKQPAEAAEKMAELAAAHQGRCVAGAGILAVAEISDVRSEAWQSAWQQAEAAITGRQVAQ